MQVLAYRRRDEVWERLTRFFGTLFLINFAMGVVTGIVQEFQFGMNWSNYSVFVGNIFGAPLAMEGLLAFFAESTFIALWMFGRDRLPPLAHTLSICVVSLGTIVSAFFILTANAWMQHPVGYRIVGGKAELTDFWAVLRNDTLWAEFSHTVLAAFVTGAMVVLGVSGWQLLRGRHVAAFTRSARLAAGVALVCTVLVMVTGDLLARLMETQQPMKMAAAEAVYRTQAGASFSLLTIGNLWRSPWAVSCCFTPCSGSSTSCSCSAPPGAASVTPANHVRPGSQASRPPPNWCTDHERTSSQPEHRVVRPDRPAVDRLPRARGVRFRRRCAQPGHRAGRPGPAAGPQRHRLGLDGNEVWLIVAAGATFAAFPVWYASLFSGFYLVLFVVLVALIVRGVSFEFRGHRDSARWRYGWDVTLAIGSLVPAFAWGVAFTDQVHGLPLSPSGLYLGGLPGLLAPVALVGGLASLAMFTAHGATFLSLKTAGPLAARAARVAALLSPLAGALVVGTAAWLSADGSHGPTARKNWPRSRRFTTSARTP